MPSTPDKKTSVPEKKPVTIKDLPPKDAGSDAENEIKGGVVGPCNRPAAKKIIGEIVGPCNFPTRTG